MFLPDLSYFTVANLQQTKQPEGINIYVEASFWFQLIFIFLLFLGMEMYANESWNKGKTKNNWTQTLTATSSSYHERYTHEVDYKVVVMTSAQNWPKTAIFSGHSPRADLGGGCRGCTPPPPWYDLRFSNTTGILPKKKYVVYWCWSRARDKCTPS